MKSTFGVFVIRTVAFRQTAFLVVLSLLLMGAGLRAQACGGACCATGQTERYSPSGEAKRISTPHPCCCDTAPIPCDLERAPAPDLPDSALSAAPRVEAPAVHLAGLPLASVGSADPGHATLGRLQPSAQGPPGPVYLRTQSFLC